MKWRERAGHRRVRRGVGRGRGAGCGRRVGRGRRQGWQLPVGSILLLQEILTSTHQVISVQCSWYYWSGYFSALLRWVCTVRINATKWLVTASLAYAKTKKHSKRSTYLRFSADQLTNRKMMCFIDGLLLMRINAIRSYRQARDKSSSQYMVRLDQLMSCNRFESMGSFLHVVTPTKGAQLASHRLKKILPLHNYVKRRWMDLYQPLQELSIDERMVKSKA